MKTFSFSDKGCLADGKPFRILSGAMHYFRIPREYWRDRLEKLLQCGFNTVETYVCWNLHEPRPGEFDFSGMLDLGGFIDTASELGLNVIVRPGPYICAEWDFGGFPAWLLETGAELRCADPVYLECAGRFLKKVLTLLAPRLVTRGGRVIMVQLENEYGSYGNDRAYLRALLDIYRECGIDCPVYTADGGTQFMLRGGSLPELPCAVNFGSDPEGNFAALRKFRPGQPLFCGEFWCGWFDHWFEGHHARSADDAAAAFGRMLDMGASVNLYMFHGGTNFGFSNGANHTGELYQPTVTSYDYSAPLSEAGDLTLMWYALRSEIGKRFGPLPPVTVKNTEKAAYGRLPLTAEAPLFENPGLLAPAVSAPAPLYCEALGQSFGYTLYSCTVEGPQEELSLGFDEVRDRALVYIDGRFRGCFLRDREAPDIRLALAPGQKARLDILCENLGRVNYGPHLADRKGIRGAKLGQQYLFGWEMRPLPAEHPVKPAWRPVSGAAAPVFLSGCLETDRPRDTFLSLSGFRKGFVTVNGINIGRYWNEAGPQKTLFVPAPFLRRGRNTVEVFESDGYDRPEILFADLPQL